MSNTAVEILKIIIDKGLLAAIVLGVGFYLNKAVEKYKADLNTAIETYKSELSKIVEQYKSRNAYIQAYHEMRLQAYQDVSQALGMHMLRIQEVISTGSRKSYVADKSLDRKKEISELKDAYHKYCESTFDHEPVIERSKVFFSHDLAEAILEYRKQVNDLYHLLNLINECDYESEGWSKCEEHFESMRRIADNLTRDLSNLQFTIAKEMAANPFSAEA